MQVTEIMTRGIEMIDADASLTEAAKKMRSLNVGALPVSKGDSLIGMITDRDITVRVIAEGRDPKTTHVRDAMTPEVCHCRDDEDVYEAARMMEERSIHRLLVLDRNDKPVGFVSLADFAVKTRDEHLAWEVLERISEPACPHR
ncbi:MAG TPA: CBS domain-containing protein [Sedimentisphaerales bacterium]|nr:CBS domain-containing protein [Sedimentisphaerales bacterium]